MTEDNKFNRRKEAFLKTKKRFGIVEKLTIEPKVLFCKNCPAKVVAVTVSDFNYERLCLDCAVEKSETRRKTLEVLTPEETSAVWFSSIFGGLFFIGSVIVGFIGLWGLYLLISEILRSLF